MAANFRHSLLDLTTFDPAIEEDDPALRVVLQRMKLARAHDMLRFFRWLPGAVRCANGTILVTSAREEDLIGATAIRSSA